MAILEGSYPVKNVLDCWWVVAQVVRIVRDVHTIPTAERSKVCQTV